VISWSELIAKLPPRPVLPGAELDPYPFISGFGMLWRIMRLTRLEPPEVFERLGLRWSASLDVLAALRDDRGPRHRFATAVGLESSPLPAYWNQSAWSPLQCRHAFEGMTHPVRTCLLCARHGYHTAMFQLHSIERCPWHGLALRDTCLYCGAPFHFRFESGRNFGACACGYDPFDVNAASARMWSFPCAQADAWLGRYFDWARSEREKRSLVIPPRSAIWSEGFRGLARPPAEMEATFGDLRIEIEEFAPKPDQTPSSRELWGWCALGSDRPLTFVPLPASLQSRLAGITRHVINALPAATRTPLELVTLNGLDEELTLRQNVDRRPDCLIAPHARTAAGETWLNLSAVDQDTLQLCGKLIDSVIATLKLGTASDERSLQAGRAQALSGLSGGRALVDALESILCRGYAQGLAAWLRGLLMPRARDLPGLWFVPVVEFVGRPGVLESLRVCWVPTEAPCLRRPCEVPVTDPEPPAPVRKQPRAKVAGTRRSRTRGGFLAASAKRG
jgi:hypothetical protein